MQAEAVFFWIFSAVLVASALAVISARNPVHSVLFLILAFVNAAGLFLLMGAEFLAMILVVVYVGAVAVLFLFVVMLLDMQGGDPRKPYQPITAAAAGVALALLTTGLLSLAERGRLPGSVPAAAPGFKEFAARLFTTYLLPVQVTGFLLLIAMLGVVVISKRLETRGAVK